MATYEINIEKAAGPAGGDIVHVGFGDPAQNDKIVVEAQSRLATLINGGEITGGELALINGPASLPVAVVLAHGLAHRYAAIGVFDPKMAAYVIAVAHGSEYIVGDLILA